MKKKKNLFVSKFVSQIVKWRSIPCGSYAFILISPGKAKVKTIGDGAVMLVECDTEINRSNHLEGIDLHMTLALPYRVFEKGLEALPKSERAYN